MRSLRRCLIARGKVIAKKDSGAKVSSLDRCLFEFVEQAPNAVRVRLTVPVGDPVAAKVSREVEAGVSAGIAALLAGLMPDRTSWHLQSL